MQISDFSRQIQEVVVPKETKLFKKVFDNFLKILASKV